MTLGIVVLGACGDGSFGIQAPGPGDDGDGDDGERVIRAESCNGLDDDADGSVDEECDCEVGTYQDCFPGDPAQAGVGICAMGRQHCESAFEFGTWKECVAATLPEAGETCGNGEDDDCNGAVDDGCPGDGDDDGDGLDDGDDGGDGDGLGGDDDGDDGDGDDGDDDDGAGDCLPVAEVCGNGLDDDCDGQADDGCECVPGDVQDCFDGAEGQLDVGACRGGQQECVDGAWGPCEGEVLPEAEICNDGIDGDCDGDAGDGCTCRAGDTRECYPGNDAEIGVGRCLAGTETCLEGADDNGWGACDGARLPRAETCGDGVDQDCDGGDEECEIVTIDLWIDGDCVWAYCPDDHPYPVGCNITFVGGDDRGCVAHAQDSNAVYFQEGNDCGAGHLSGTMSCSNGPGDALNAFNCPINKEEQFYFASANSCPD